MEYSLSKATIALERRFDMDGTRISVRKDGLIRRWATAAVRVANEQVGKGDLALWNEAYHTEMDRTTKAAGLRV